MRRAVLMGTMLACLACDTMISDRLIITTPPETAHHGNTLQVVEAIRQILADNGLHRTPRSGGDEWEWRDPEHPPGVHVTIRPSGNRVSVRLAQDLYGPVGPTEKYRVVRESLLSNMRQRYGEASVAVE